jgi:hypothetical protein
MAVENASTRSSTSFTTSKSKLLVEIHVV